VIPNAQRINRGGLVLSELVETARGHAFTDVVILHEHRGEPGVCTHGCVCVRVMRSRFMGACAGVDGRMHAATTAQCPLAPQLTT
jgi:hypothetical protein